MLKSNVEIHLEPGAVWKAWDTIEEYYPLRNNGRITAHESGLPSFLNSEYAGRPFNAFIYALEEENITISGQGTIDGNESIFYVDNSGYHIEGTYSPRVPLLLLEAVNHLTIRGVRLVNCAFWTVHLVGCNDVLIDGIRLTGEFLSRSGTAAMWKMLSSPISASRRGVSLTNGGGEQKRSA